ncbi:MAG: glycosyl hydrolase [Candidatus Portnoybacteria bacterium CG_4_10_14_0_2_um_filter_44_20]|uniref:Glycosyl hydrolase n=1 Tax=Candidatus Portnoybacteria bacterium CG_4_10_14_0_2_um_filter_44_20 TaxID=1974799 RepID=A0A2M7ULR2_9BACT|nr:MAG: glycosyl hydrolase [Candidatus Portnoybacteria bacterium CG_4_10_14_0_2_um_filter_44_20]
MNLSTLKKELRRIKKLGFVPTHRTGDTGIGKTLEDLLNIKENNIPLHDIAGVAELKAYRKNAKSMLTLFTLEPLPKGGDRDRMLLDNFGYSKRNNGRSKELHSTLSCKRYNNQSLKLSVSGDKIRVQGKGKRLNIYWDMESVQKKFGNKLPALVYVLAESKEIKGKEHFHFSEAYLLSGFDFEVFKKMVKKDQIVVDFRMYYKPNGSVRNHGTGFRVKINKLYNCFRNKDRLI